MDRDTKFAEYVRDAVRAKLGDAYSLDLPSLIARFRAEHPEGGEAERERLANRCRVLRMAHGGAVAEHSPAFTVADMEGALALARPSPHPEGDVRAAVIDEVEATFKTPSRSHIERFVTGYPTGDKAASDHLRYLARKARAGEKP